MRPFLFFLLAIVFGLGAYFVATKNNGAETPNNGQVSEQNSEANPYADWQEYKNEEYGVELHIPPSHQFTEDKQSSSQLGNTFVLNIFQKNEMDPDQFISSMNFIVYEDSNSLDLESWIQKNEQTLVQINDRENFILAGHPATKFLDNEMGLQSPSVFLQSQNRIFAFSSAIDSELFKDFYTSLIIR